MRPGPMSGFCKASPSRPPGPKKGSIRVRELIWLEGLVYTLSILKVVHE